jgi:hypothetical protein
MGMTVIKCKLCNQAMTVPTRYKKIKVECPNPDCKHKFYFNYKQFKRKKTLINNFPYFIVFLLLTIIIINGLRISNKISLIKDDLRESNNQVLIIQENKLKGELIVLNEKYNLEIASVNVKTLQNEATQHYNKIWNERANFENKYAITSREKTLLEMKNIATNKNTSINKIIKKIAKKASPNNSEIKVLSTKKGRILEINFDMSELTAGEIGSSTKHKTIESLKKETIKLISKVSNDVYEFCYDIELVSIHIGLKHVVRQYINDQFEGEENQIIYKIKIDKDKIGKLENNPFLDLYSTTKNLSVLLDEFPNLKLDLDSNSDYNY